MIEAITNRAISIYGQAATFQGFIIVANKVTNSIVVSCCCNIRHLSIDTFSFVDVFS